ncbi:hypothetical protein DFH07DRAFT_856100 [Mycena maculata]|uniref:Uncharacterized protein n=1 Tax=Mycena maculata TaxID=230809 RepID=A0AAD7HLZ9_9AGAR|nr:hypothetical protein DFH07DRAFT_856100 [Mycena maculata]
MSPVNSFPTARNILSEIASATVVSITGSAVPAPTESPEPPDVVDKISKVVPPWVAYLFPAMFCVLFALWWAWARVRRPSFPTSHS